MSVDSRTNSNTPALSTATTVTLTNLGRKGFVIQSQGTGALFINFGNPVVANANYHISLGGSGYASNGTGAIFTMVGGSCFAGPIYASGTGASYTYLEY